MDNWKHRAKGMVCGTCMYFVVKKLVEGNIPVDKRVIGRCRKNSPTMAGWPVMFENDWCGQHKLDETKV